ncbi:restriction endonuclease subunit S [Acinetobacter pittii]|uniref:restriction endonuclease subunit S n=1 Tax=Acinetobacter TaxID=469 RepID=UPI0015D2D743|nr:MULTISPECIES: restriction endonuclease subunit S [Acinetobacter]MDX8274662.1 restriction endonuclease subunit S [Acinetobacter pittii]UUS57851.1 restriction endonuclease subunit S [Acinetobacter sp. YH16040_T]
MAKYQAYAEYKDSGVQWLGEIPSHWKLTRLKFLAKIRNGQDYKHVETETGFPVMGSGGQFTFSSTYMFNRPSVLLGRKGTIDKPLYIDEPFWTVDTMYYTEVNKDIDVKYFYYLSKTILFNRYSTNTALPSMTQENLNNFEFSVPPSVFERNQIRNFLDHETAKIDHLIEQQQQLIELLKEKRQAVISHAVTKGLDPNVPMKDSGVEWLGEVPEHWKIIKGGYIGTLFGSESIQEDDVTDQGSLPFIKVSSLSAETFKLSNIDWFVSERRAKFCKAEKNYIVFPKRGAAIFTNKVNVIEVDSVIDPNLMGWKIGKQGITEYFALLLKTRGLDDIADVSTVPQINNKHIAPEKFPLPPLSEQCEIVKFVGMELTKFDEMILKAESAIQLMQERRTALISAAVTGKIDVRHWQAPTVAEAHPELSA